MVNGNMEERIKRKVIDMKCPTHEVEGGYGFGVYVYQQPNGSPWACLQVEGD